jgi:hypothetical protein
MITDLRRTILVAWLNWSVVLGIEVEMWQVALCMNQVKVARLVNQPAKVDGWIDGAAYMALGGELATE